MNYCVIYLTNGEQFCVKTDDYEYVKEKLDPTEYIELRDLDGCLRFISTEMISSLAISTAESRKSWMRNSAYLDREKQKAMADLSDPINLL